MRIKVAALVTAMVAIPFSAAMMAIIPAHASAAAALPEMCNGRSDPGLHFVAQANGQRISVPPYFAAISNDAAGRPTGTLIVSVGSERLVATSWCRAWQHLPGQPGGDCGEAYPQGAITAHAVGTAELDGQELLVRTDVRQMPSGEMLFRVRYRPLAMVETPGEDDCEVGWTRIPASSWDPLDHMRAATVTSPAGYWLAGADGGVFGFNTPFYGSMAGRALNQPVVGIADDPATGGYWLAAADGGVFTFNAPFFGSAARTLLQKPVVGIAEDPPTDGYWLAAADGGVFTYGAAPYYGSMGGRALNQPVVGIADDPATGGYRLVAADGGVFTFNAAFFGSAAGIPLRKPVVGIASTPGGNGYWLVAADGGVFTFGDAHFYGSLVGTHLNQPVTGLVPTPSGNGYWLVAADGGVFAFGDAHFYGSLVGTHLNKATVGITSNP